MNNLKLMQGDCLEQMKQLPDNSIDSIVTDPPYGLSFMGKKWDYDVPSVVVWQECLRVLKPGGHLLAFAGTRTQHRMAVRIEDAGFEIRDMIAWCYGSGFPKSLDVSKAIDKAAGAEREEIPATGGLHKNANLNDDGWSKIRSESATMWGNKPATTAAQQWQGWGTALKPALEPITVARKPIVGTVAANVLEYGTGAINVDATRIPALGENLSGGGTQIEHAGWGKSLCGKTDSAKAEVLGRWPANLIHSGEEDAIAGLGEAARYFYCAKASKRDRDEGLEGFEQKQTAAMQGNLVNGQRLAGDGTPIATPVRANTHPTVKPTDLMRYLCRLVTPPNGTVLDPFMGSGSTGKAAMREGFQFVGIERDEQYFEIAKARITSAVESKPLI